MAQEIPDLRSFMRPVRCHACASLLSRRYTDFIFDVSDGRLDGGLNGVDPPPRALIFSSAESSLLMHEQYLLFANASDRHRGGCGGRNHAMDVVTAIWCHARRCCHVRNCGRCAGDGCACRKLYPRPARCGRRSRTDADSAVRASSFTIRWNDIGSRADGVAPAGAVSRQADDSAPLGSRFPRRSRIWG